MADQRRRPRPGRYPISYGVAELLQDADREHGWVLSVDGVLQSHVDLADPTFLDFEYMRLMADVVDCLDPGWDTGHTPLDAVHIGGGACTLPRYIAATRPGSRQLVFEPDAGLVRLVREQLGLGRVRGLKLRVTDGRSGVAALPDGADDLIVLDAFRKAAVPSELITLEFTREVARVLRDDGVYLINVADGSPLLLARRVLATVAETFPHAVLLSEPAVLRGRRFGNIVLAGSRSPLPVAALTRRAASGLPRARCMEGEELIRFRGGALPLCDGDEVPVPQPPPGVFGRA